MASSSRITRIRLIYLLVVFTVIPALLICRIGFWQLVAGEGLQKEAIEQQTRDRVVASKRGKILDRNGKQLAVSATVETVSCTPKEVTKSKKQEEIATTLSKLLNMDRDEVLKRITKVSSYEIIKKKVEKDVADQIRQSKLPGIHLDEDSKRYYPYGNFAAQLIGVTGNDNQGLFGIEAKYDRYLKGQPGRIVTATDAQGVEMPYNYERYVNPQEGANVVLAIDEVIQHFVEKHLETAVLDNKVEKGGAAIVMDPKTGEILAMAVKPDFDLNAPFTLKPEVQAEVDKLDPTTKKERIGQEVSKMWRNKAIVDSYEPGSTFKIITSAMGLEENMITPETTFNCAGAFTVAGRAIKCWRYYRPHGLQTFKQGVQNSCNPVFIDIGLRAGADIFYNYVKGFGFLERTGIDFDGETQGIFHQKKNMHELEVATASFGQGFQVTPLQMIAAASAVANGGKLLKPHLVKQIVDVEGNTIKNVEPEMVRQVISQQTCDILKPVLESVVSEGTAQNAFISGFRVGGKTGTSEKLPRGQNNYIASFVGMAPCNDPRVVVILVLDEPKGKDYYGGIIAAPVVGKIMDDVLRYLEVEPQYNDSELSKLEVGVPQAVGADVSEAKSRMTEAKLTAKIIGNGKTVLEQTPKAGVKILEKSQVLLYTEAAQAKANVTIPNLTGKSVLDATKALNAIGLNIRVSGAGQVTKQDPPAGSTVVVGSIVAVDFRAQSQEVGVE